MHGETSWLIVFYPLNEPTSRLCSLDLWMQLVQTKNWNPRKREAHAYELYNPIAKVMHRKTQMKCKCVYVCVCVFFFSSIITVMYVEWTLGTKMFYNWGCGVRTKHSELSSVSVGYKGLGWRYFRWWGRPSDARWYYRSLLVAFHYLVFASWLRPINALHDSGGKRILRLPPELGYGMRGAGCRGGTSEWFSSCTNLIS